MRTMIPLVKPYFPPREELMPALEEILYSGYVATGQPVFDFEDKFKKGDTFVFTAFGAGFVHGASCLKWAYDGASVGK